nr:hypothetical protein [Microbacterium testaceum]
MLIAVVGLLVGCTPPDAEGSGAVEVREGQAATLTAGPDEDLTVELPASAIKGSGQLSAEAITGPDGIPGWSIELTGGAELVGPATLTFKGTLEEGEPLPLISSTADGVTYEPAEVRASGDGGVTVETSHFSNWFTLWWDDVLANARKGLDAIYRDGGKPPTCEGEDAVRSAGYSITSDEGSRVFWCLGQTQDITAHLKVVNARGYTVAAEHTPGLSVTAGGSDDFLGLIANAIRESPSLRSNTVTLVGPGSTIEYDISGSAQAGVQLKPSVAGYLVTAGQYAVDTLAMVLAHGGKSGMSKFDIAKLFDWESCLAGYTSMTAAQVETATQASNTFNDAVGTTLGCMSGALERAGLSFWGTAVAGALSWLVAGIRTALNGFGAAADTALNPNGYSIVVTPPAASASERWIISGKGVGPMLIGAPLDEVMPLLEGHVACLGDPWGVAPSGTAGVVEGINVEGYPGDDTPITKSGITLGTPVSKVEALGATSKPWEKNTSSLIYSWTEDGAAFSAQVDGGIVTSVGVGSFFRYLDC